MTRKRAFPGDPDQNQGLADALDGFTRGSAYAGFDEHRRGMLKVGMDADIVILDADLRKTDPEAIANVKPVVTLSRGRVTFEQ